ncbi:nuclear pore glycoprotein p62-like [Rhipicephalus microplus]|uniref:nuclear pore glycoprotein p62-like n=1 Tax=Rhipicephalus microplus TaxID=6941 RepID=UPI003F6D1BAE
MSGGNPSSSFTSRIPATPTAPPPTITANTAPGFTAATAASCTCTATEPPPITTAPGTATATAPPPATSATTAPGTATATAPPPTTTTAPGTTIAKMTMTSAITRVTGTTVPPPKMSYRQLEESVDQWMREMKELEKSFIDQATLVNARDRAVLASVDRVGQLSLRVKSAQLHQKQLEHGLDYVAAQQNELERLLAPLEAAMNQAPTLSVQQHADLEREVTYRMTEDINSRLNSTAWDAKDLTGRLNAAHASNVHEEPLQQISKVLSSQVDALKWIEKKSAVLQQKLAELKHACEQQKEDPVLKG